MRSFTFYQLVRSGSGYALVPYITVYPDMIEVNRHG